MQRRDEHFLEDDFITKAGLLQLQSQSTFSAFKTHAPCLPETIAL